MDRQELLSKAYEEVFDTGALRENEVENNVAILTNGMKAYSKRHSCDFTDDEIKAYIKTQEKVLEKLLATDKYIEKMQRI